jgi:hypothetical protein
MMLVSADWRDRVISPGPLAVQHAQLLERDGAAPQCAACHAAADDGLVGWTASLVVGHADSHTQSQLCMKCHSKTIDAELALAAHNVPPDRLAEITGDRGGTRRDVACAACHREHQGADFDLTAMSNASCQACHRQRYDSFAGDHPDFGAWPYERRTRIVFDHAAHQAKHFAKSDQPFDCRGCHLDDATGDVQLLANYGAACAACHDEKIDTSLARGVPMLALPTIDVDALRAAGIHVGRWPEMATGDFDGQLPPMMKLLLAADPTAARALDALGPDFEFIDVDPDDSEHLRAAGDLAAAIERLVSDLSQRGPAAVRQRLQTALGREVSDAELRALVAGLSVDTLRPAVAAWLPDIDAGDSEWTDGKDSRSESLIPEPRTLNPEPAYDPAGAWSRDDATFTIRYQPVSHADPVLTSWLALVVSTPNADRKPLVSAMLKELTKPTAPGLCASCHSVERTAAGRLVINWRADDRRSEPRSLTTFSHGPHLVLPQLADCTHCHALDTSASTASSYVDWNPHTFASEFLLLSKRACVECHTPTAAGDRCQSCHNYHVELVEQWQTDPGVRSQEPGVRETGLGRLE